MRTYETLYIKVYRTEKQYVFVILSKIGPPLKISSPPFLNEGVAKGGFLSKVCPPIHAIV